MIDKDTFRSVFAEFDAEIVDDIINIYLNEHPVKFNDIELALEQRDFKRISGTAHGLKGILSQFFAAEAQQQAKDLELQARQLDEYFSVNHNEEMTDEQHKQLSERIISLKNSSLRVIEDLKELQKEFH